MRRTNVAVIQEVYDGEYSQQCFAIELERALDAGCEVIVIEPQQLGDETARWISVGNCLHKTAVVSGLGAIVTGESKNFDFHIEKKWIFQDYCGGTDR